MASPPCTRSILIFFFSLYLTSIALNSLQGIYDASFNPEQSASIIIITDVGTEEHAQDHRSCWITERETMSLNFIIAYLPFFSVDTLQAP